MRTRSLILSALLSACAVPQAAEKREAPAVVEGGPAFADYLPLAVGSEWTYEAKAMGQGSRDTIRIVGRDGAWYLDDHRGRMRYEDDGVRDRDRYLLRAPLAAGKTWTAVENLVVQRFSIVSVDASVEVPAGRYSRVVVVRNEQPLGNGARFVTEWSYAPGVGLVLLRTSTVAQGKEQEQSSLRLLSYKPAATK